MASPVSSTINAPVLVQKLDDDSQRVFENVNDAIFIHDLAGNFLTVNQVACQRLGYTRDELLHIHLSQLDSPEDAERYAERIALLLQQGNLVLESRHRCKNGTLIPVEVNARVIQFDGAPAILSVVRDITERKKAEETLRQAEEKYRNIYEHAVEGIFQSTPDGHFISVNSAMARIYGYTSAEEMIASVSNDIPHKVYANPAHRAEFARLLEERGIVQNFEAPNLRKDGAVIWTNTNARAVRDADGRLLHYEGFLEDITERRHTLEALRKSEERFAAQYKGIPIPTYTWKKVEQDFILIDYNDAAYAITNGEITSFLRERASKLYRDEPEVYQELARCFSKRNTLRREMKMHLRPNAPLVDLVFSFAYIPPDLVMVHTEDITQRKQAEAALRDSEARYRMLMEQAADGIVVVDSQTRFIDTNSTACALLDYTREELLHKKVADILAPRSIDVAPFPFDAMRQGKTVVIERLMQRKNGTLFPVEIRAKMLPDGTFQGIVRDISERKQLESALQAMLNAQRQWNAELEVTVRAKTAELRQLSETRDQLLRQIIVAQEEERRRMARELHDETSQALTALIANLAVVQTLPASKAKAHFDEIKNSVVEILKGVNQIVLDLRPTLLDDYGLMPALSWYANKRLGSEVRIKIDAPESELCLPPTIKTTLFRIGQEAIGNISKYAKASCVRMSLLCADDGKQITLQVEDNGVGFSTDRVKEQTQPERPHLGLLGMQERVQLIGGKLRIESASGKGTLISVSVPLGEPLVEE